MKRAIIAGLIILILFGAGSPPRITITIDGPVRSFELDSEPLTCADTRIAINTSFGSRSDCTSRCDRTPTADGSYTATISIDELRCLGPNGAVTIPGTRASETIPIAFCADDACTSILDYCDCIAPNLTIESSDAWYSEPYTITVRASDNHNLSRIETPALTACDAPTCSANITLPIGAACSETGSGACAIRVNATDRWENSAQLAARFNVDRSAPTTEHEWLQDGPWHRDHVTIRFTAREASIDESGVSSIWIETRSEPGCSEPGSNYTRYAADTVELTERDLGSGVAFCAYATDRAQPANTGAVKRTGTRFADSEAPILTLEPAPGWHATERAVTVTCTDRGSGCLAYGHVIADEPCPAPGESAYRTDDLSARCEAGSACEYAICAYGTDAVNYTSTATRSFGIDRSRPVIERTNSDVENPDVLEVLITDSGSGLSTCTIAFDDTAPAPCAVSGALSALSIPIPCDGTCPYAIRATDLVGNEAILEGWTHGWI